jgi:hypothetical protein
MAYEEVIKLTLDLWDQIGLEYGIRYKDKPSLPVWITLFERTHTFIIHKNITKERQGVRDQKESAKSEAGHCNECGRKLTDKEQYFIKQNNTTEVCYHCSQKGK